ncbi:hypothetical protein FGRMN_5200 [Fusarium graminum]|nr:hypothetical protein FGRMN_5200 [Fusarium graminum]
MSQADSYNRKVSACLTSYQKPSTQEEYRKIAEDMRNLCEELLKKNGIRGVVTCRVKAYDSLSKKLSDMASDTSFRDWVSSNDILNHHEMGDLAGVRIGLYLPQDVIRMAKECKRHFKLVHCFGSVPSGRDTPRRGRMNLEAHNKGRFHSVDQFGSDEYWHHSGYKSWQMVVEKKKARAEIQLGTVVSQAWAEVQHNVLYKRPDNIFSSPTMKRMIDGINGLAITTEIMLDELERSVEIAKAEEKDRKYREDQYDRMLIKTEDDFVSWFDVTYWHKMPNTLALRWEPNAISVLRLVQFCTTPGYQLGLTKELKAYPGSHYKRLVEEKNLLQTDAGSDDKCDIANLLFLEILDSLGKRRDFETMEENRSWFQSANLSTGLSKWAR